MKTSGTGGFTWLMRLPRLPMLVAAATLAAGCVSPYIVIPNLGGIVVDSERGTPIAGATIHVRGQDDRDFDAVTDASGSFSIPGVTAVGGHLNAIPMIVMLVQAPGYQLKNLSGTYPYYMTGMVIRLQPETPPPFELTVSQERAARLVAEIEATMVPIPAGTARLGAKIGHPAHGYNIRDVTLHAFRMSAYEATFDQYDVFAQSRDRPLPDDHGWGRDRHPVINVSWEDAQAFIVWLNAVSHRHYRLPSEAEWEYAARAGTTTKYYWGDKPDPQFMDAYRVSTEKVGAFPPNRWGLYDMFGLAQWMEDCWNTPSFWSISGRFTDPPLDNTPWSTGDCALRVIRGGSARDQLEFTFGVAGRAYEMMRARRDYIGFRLAEDP